MSNQTQKRPYILRRSEIHIPTEQGEIIYIHPAVSPGTYQTVGKEILNAGFAVPHGKETAPLVHAAYYSKVKGEPEFENIRKLIRNRWLLVFNQNTYTDAGMYSLEDRKAQGRDKPLTIKSLEKMLKDGKELSWGGIRLSKDRSVGFAPKGSYTFGKQTAKTLAEQGNFIIQYGVRGAELLCSVVETIGKPAYTSGVNVKEGAAPEVRGSGLCEFDGGLHFVGVFHCGVDGYAFAVSTPSAKISR